MVVSGELVQYKEAQCWYQTAKGTENYLNSRIIPSLGNIKLAQLTSLHMQNYVNSLRMKVLKRGQSRR